MNIELKTRAIGTPPPDDSEPKIACTRSAPTKFQSPSMNVACCLCSSACALSRSRNLVFYTMERRIRVQPNDVRSRAAGPDKTQRASLGRHQDLVLDLLEPPHEGQPDTEDDATSNRRSSFHPETGALVDVVPVRCRQVLRILRNPSRVLSAHGLFKLSPLPNWRSSPPVALTPLTSAQYRRVLLHAASAVAPRSPPAGPRRTSRCRPPSPQHPPHALA